MSYTYNITFATSPEKGNNMLCYLRDIFIHKIAIMDYGEIKVELKKIIEVGDERPDPDEGLNIAFSAVFHTEEQARLWHDHALMPALSDFYNIFGDTALYFITFMENLSL